MACKMGETIYFFPPISSNDKQAVWMTFPLKRCFCISATLLSNSAGEYFLR